MPVRPYHISSLTMAFASASGQCPASSERLLQRPFQNRPPSNLRCTQPHVLGWDLSLGTRHLTPCRMWCPSVLYGLHTHNTVGFRYLTIPSLAPLNKPEQQKQEMAKKNACVLSQVPLLWCIRRGQAKKALVKMQSHQRASFLQLLVQQWQVPKEGSKWVF